MFVTSSLYTLRAWPSSASSCQSGKGTARPAFGARARRPPGSMGTVPRQDHRGGRAVSATPAPALLGSEPACRHPRCSGRPAPPRCRAPARRRPRPRHSGAPAPTAPGRASGCLPCEATPHAHRRGGRRARPPGCRDLLASLLLAGRQARSRRGGAGDGPRRDRPGNTLMSMLGNISGSSPASSGNSARSAALYNGLVASTGPEPVGDLLIWTLSPDRRQLTFGCARRLSARWPMFTAYDVLFARRPWRQDPSAYKEDFRAVGPSRR
jgi:hypothetical protein